MKCSRGVTRFLLPLKNQQHILRQTLHVDMSATSSFLSHDELLCCICLDVFTDPVTIPCKHSFCKNCITQHWTLNVRNTCPMCRSAFHRRPELNVDASIAEKVHQLRQLTGRESSICSKERQDKADVLCDVCARTKRKAVKSCLVCLTSFCDTHLEHHHRFPGLRRHQLMDPVKNLEDKLCKKHGRALVLLCRIQ
ncbi:E3 ubiquitin/ISG15 ligase TRIM25-like [Amphiprion ocellaris]|uniref:E3 ubiquitin/ISG15 ligase TRIM25-like n=1 Tax=Amphiprion ocellaris TaxID=80972 RepID=UPI001649C156|nr:E3 ubiquitin/ISG15 ligase TRIM25-like [Amphiprion ocellaris]